MLLSVTAALVVGGFFVSAGVVFAAPVLGDVTLTNDAGGNLVLTVKASDNEGLATLEVDHSLEGLLPEFTVGIEDVVASAETMGAGFTFANANDTWTLSFGPTVSETIRKNADSMTFYFVITDVNGNRFGSMSPTTAENTRTFPVPAAPVETVPPVLGDVTLTNDAGGNLVLTVKASDNEGLATLEVDHSLEGLLPEFTVGIEDVVASAETMGAGFTFANANDTWTLSFGPTVSETIRKNADSMTFYFVITDVNGNRFGSMSPTTAENTRTFPVPAAPVETVPPVLGDVTLTNDAGGNLVLTVKASDNEGLATLEVDHSLEGLLPEFTVGIEDVVASAETMGAGFTFANANDTWTLSFGPTVSETIRKNADSMTFYFVITDVNGNRFGSMSPTTAENTRTFPVPAAPVETVPPVLGDVTLTNDAGGNLVLTVKASDNEGLATLEVDHSLEGLLPEFTVGIEDVVASAETMGAGFTFANANDTWTLSFGPTVSETIRKNADSMTFYFVITDVNGNRFGSMSPTTAENTRTFPVPAAPVETVPPVLGDVTLTNDAGGNLVLTVKASDNEGLATLEVDHSLEGLLPEFTVGIEDVVASAETMGAGFTFANANDTWTLSFGPTVSETIRKNADSMTFYFVITDVNGNRFGSMSPTTAENTRTFPVPAAPVETVPPVLGDVTLTNDAGGNLVLTVKASDNEGLATLEVDHSLEGLLPEFTVGTEEVEASAETMGAGFTFANANDTWTLSFGPTVSETIRKNADSMTFYFVITDVNGNRFGSMSPTTAENTRTFPVPAVPVVEDKESPVLEEATLTTDEDENLVLTVKASDNVGLLSLEVDHSLEGLLPEFTVGTEEVEASAETMWTSSTFSDRTWTLNFGPSVSKTIRDNIASMTFYFVITDVNGNRFGSMSPTTAENTRTFEVPAAPVKPAVSVELPKDGFEVVISDLNQAVIITVDSGTNNATLNLDALITNGTVTLPSIIINSSNANISIPDSTLVTSADPNWNGIMMAPTVTSVTLPVISGQTLSPSTAIEIGFSGAKLTFDKAVKITMLGQAGKRAGYTRNGEAFTEITNVCSADTQDAGNALVQDSECKIDSGADLVIWTKHFTKFATYTQTTNVVSRGGGGGGYYIQPVKTTPVVAPVVALNPVVVTPTSVVGQVLGAESFTFTKSMKKGSKGDEVMELQKFLNDAGYDCGIADGKFGQKTKDAVIKFQLANGLKGDGSVGANTRAVLNKSKDNDSQVLGAESFTFTKSMKKGSKGDEVMELQKFLNDAGYDCGIADGKFGQKTKDAVIKFQLANGLKGDGSVGANTRVVLNKSKDNDSQVLGAESFTFTKSMKKGSKGDEVMELQKFLNDAGYDCGIADGKFGQKTKDAVIKFQLANGLKGDGSVGAITLINLNK